MTELTPKFQLELYEGSDKADLTDQYNNSMRKLDDSLSEYEETVNAGNEQFKTEVNEELAGMTATIATLNSNINATNLNLQDHVSKSDAKFAEIDGEISTVKADIAEINDKITADKTELDTKIEQNATDIANLETTLGTEQEHITEHGNWFAQLGVTDEQSATDLHTEIDNSMQGVMSLTQSVDTLNQQVEALGAGLNHKITVGTFSNEDQETLKAALPSWFDPDFEYVQFEGHFTFATIWAAANSKTPISKKYNKVETWEDSKYEYLNVSGFFEYQLEGTFSNTSVSYSAKNTYLFSSYTESTLPARFKEVTEEQEPKLVCYDTQLVYFPIYKKTIGTEPLHVNVPIYNLLGEDAVFGDKTSHGQFGFFYAENSFQVKTELESLGDFSSATNGAIFKINSMVFRHAKETENA